MAPTGTRKVIHVIHIWKDSLVRLTCELFLGLMGFLLPVSDRFSEDKST